MTKHCDTCRCHEIPTPKPVKAGDTIKDRLTGEIGVVQFTQAPNPPWHNGGVPFVRVEHDVKASGYWHYYDQVVSAAPEDVARAERIRQARFQRGLSDAQAGEPATEASPEYQQGYEKGR